MKIDSYAVGMQASTSSVKIHSVTETTVATVTLPNGENAAQGQGGNAGALLMLSPEAQAQSLIQQRDNMRNQGMDSPFPIHDEGRMKIMLLEKMVSALTGKTLRFQPLQNMFGNTGNGMQPLQQLTQMEMPRINLVNQRTESYYEAHQMSFQAQGVVNTSDGRQIKFDLNVFSSYEFSTSSTVTTAVQRLADPLVLNFDGTLPQFTKDRYEFDITIDGNFEKIFMPTNGSGFLALDRDGNGKIDDGSELFGAKTGNGFAELAMYDSDGNGWIDENDDVFADLKIMFADKETGEFMLMTLKESGVGAIFLGSAKGGYEIKGDNNELVGIVQRHGIFLHEDGRAGSIHHIDLSY